jgi:hypothetical protein
MRDTKEQPFTIVALDENLDTITMVPYSNLQWNRKYHEPGTFSIVLNNRVQYTKDWKYIYTSARPEIGRISQVNWSKKSNVSTVTSVPFSNLSRADTLIATIFFVFLLVKPLLGSLLYNGI